MKRLLSCSAVLLLCAVAVMAQATTTLTGVVTDPTGAAIPGAAIVIENLGTNATRDTVSDAQGRYQFVQVTPGAYRIKAKAQGFSDVIVNDVRLLVNTPATVNVSFEKVGSVATTVEVSAEAVQVNTTDATLGNSFGTKPILQLPFEGRNIVGLLALQPGVSFTADANTATDRSGAVNGGRSDQANVTLDGVDVNDQQTRSAFTSALRVPLDSVQEFRVTTTNANADMGRSSGAQISLVTKSGTNDFHGSAYWYLRNKATNANSFLNNSAGVPLSKL
ncbi:MAG: carboxypeptidase-like regulatory domain-containing protein, partial [Bryobacter sp.]|nr:carboxypeptidase-like regulatory domain-containing protein [Bryobacter sp.]